jgi:peroxiredoxin
MMRISFLLFFVVSLACCSSNSGQSDNNTNSTERKSLNIQLKVNGFANSYVKLLGFFADKQYGIDSAYVDAKGNAVFKQDTSLRGGMYLVVFSENKFIQILIDKDQQFTLEFDYNNPVHTMKVSNSLDNELLYKNLKFESQIAPKFESVQQQMNQFPKGSEQYIAAELQQQQLIEERKAHIKWFSDNHPDAFFTKFKIAGQNAELRNPKRPDGSIDDFMQTYYFINDYWNGYDFSDERMLRTPVYFNKLKKYVKDFSPQDADSLIKYCDKVIDLSKANKEMFKFTANWIALQYKEPKVMGQDAFYVHLIEKYWTYDQAFWSEKYEIDRLRAQVRQMKPSLIGQTGQNVTGTNEYGQQISIYDIKAPYTVVYIFSYDCETCKKETPKLVQMYNEWKNKGVDVFSICIDGDKEKWKAYLKQNNMTFSNMFDPKNETSFRLKYYVDVTPEVYVLNKDHKIIASNIGPASVPEVVMKDMKK